jgi:transposase
MDRFIGLDVHASSCTIAVMGPSGKRLRSQVVETNGEALVNCLKAVPGTLHLCLEECTQSAWLAEILGPHVARLVVTGVGQRASKGAKDDKRDALALADKLRVNDIEAVVYKPQGPYATLRQLVKTHAQIVQDVVRVQNRIWALFRARGVVVPSTTVYSPRGRTPFVEPLPSSVRAAAEHLYGQYDALLPVKGSAEKDLVAESHRHAISKVLETCPGLGPIRVAQLIATVVSPQRFRRRNQFWSYCGLGILMRSSADWQQMPDGSWQRVTAKTTRGLTRRYNRILKAVFKGAATTVLTMRRTDEPMWQSYQRQLFAGTKPNLAKLTLARKLAATALAMWKTQEVYDPKRLLTA